jgi:creatinine amidohydrolase
MPCVQRPCHPTDRFLPNLSWTEIAELPDKANTVIVLPTGAAERHGPHRPCAVDSVIAAGVVGHALARLPDTVKAYAMSAITCGESDEHLDFPGTVTLTGKTLVSVMTQVGESVYRSGFRKLLIVNAHGGPPQVMEMAACELRLRPCDFIVVPTSAWRVPHAAGRYLSEREKKLSMRAGHAETAIMLALAPHTVHMERAVSNYPPEFPSPLLSPDGRPACAWTARDFGLSGVTGDPLPATAEQGQGQGQAIIESSAGSWAQAITESHQLSWCPPA